MKKVALLILMLSVLSVTVLGQRSAITTKNARRLRSGTASPNGVVPCTPGPPFTDVYIRTTDHSEYHCTAAPSTWTQVTSGSVSSGDVAGPASSVDNELVLFSGTGGKTIKRASGTGIVKETAGVIGVAVAGDFPTLNQNTSGTAANVSGTPALPNGTTATTQSQADNSTNLATTAYVDTGLAGKGTVTSISGTANQVSVANPTTTPVLSFPSAVQINLGAVTPPTAFTVGDTSSSTPRGLMSWQSSDDTSSAHLHMRKSRGTFATPTTIVTGDVLGRLVFAGYEGSAYNESAYFRCLSTGTIAATRVPTKCEFYTSTNATPSVATLALTLNSDQSATFANTVNAATFVGAVTGNASTASNLSGTPALPNGTTGTTQSQADASTKLATTAYVDTGLGGKQSTLTNSAGLRAALSDELGTGADLFDGATPTSFVLTNATGLPVAGLSNLGTNVGTFLITPTSANFFGAITDESGTGAVVGQTSPTLSTPRISQVIGGTAAGSNLNLQATTSASPSGEAIVFKVGNNGATVVGTMTGAANFKLSGTAVRGTTEGTNHLDIFDGTAPVGTLANGISLYSTAGELRVIDSGGTATLLSSHSRVTGEWIHDSYSSIQKKRLIVQAEEMSKFIDAKFGTHFVQEIYDDQPASGVIKPIPLTTPTNAPIPANIGGTQLLTPTPGATVTLSIDATAKHIVASWTSSEAETINVSGTPQDGAMLTLIITNDATLGRLLTAGTGLSALTTVLNIVSKKTTVSFVALNGTFYETSRTIGL